jgi:hypothetical protein
MLSARALTAVGLLALVLVGTAASAGDPRRVAAADDPDPGFLEFLGSVDRLAEVNPNYLAQAKVAQVTKPPPPKSGARPPPRPSPNPGASGVNNNE